MLALAAAFGLSSTWWLHQTPTQLALTAQQGLQASQASPQLKAAGNTQAAGVSISTGALMAISLPGPDGKPHTLAEWQGRPLVINFWATWCDPCRAELPLLNAAAQNPALKGATVLGIALDEGKAVQAFLGSNPMSFPVLIDANSVGEGLAGRLGDSTGALPFTAILDRSGVVVETRLGPWKNGELEARLTQLTGS